MGAITSGGRTCGCQNMKLLDYYDDDNKEYDSIQDVNGKIIQSY